MATNALQWSPGPAPLLGVARLLVVPLVVVGQFQPGVERHHVPDVQLHAARLQPFDDAVQFVAVLLLHARPEDFSAALRKNAQSFFSSWTISVEIALKVSLISAASRYAVLEADLRRACPPGAPGSSRCARSRATAFLRRGSICGFARNQREPPRPAAEQRRRRRCVASRYYSRGSMDDTDSTQKVNRARESRGLSVQTESKVFGQGSGERAPLGR